jgi:hypothetical protein
VCQLDNNCRSMLACEFLHLADNFRVPTRIATLASLSPSHDPSTPEPTPLLPARE